MKKIGASSILAGIGSGGEADIFQDRLGTEEMQNSLKLSAENIDLFTRNAGDLLAASALKSPVIAKLIEEGIGAEWSADLLKASSPEFMHQSAIVLGLDTVLDLSKNMSPGDYKLFVSLTDPGRIISALKEGISAEDIGKFVSIAGPERMAEAFNIDLQATVRLAAGMRIDGKIDAAGLYLKSVDVENVGKLLGVYSENPVAMSSLMKTFDPRFVGYAADAIGKDLALNPEIYRPILSDLSLKLGSNAAEYVKIGGLPAIRAFEANPAGIEKSINEAGVGLTAQGARLFGLRSGGEPGNLSAGYHADEGRTWRICGSQVP